MRALVAAGSVIGAVVVGATALSGCSGPVACPAIGYSDTVPITLRGAVDRVVLVQGCDGDGCSTSAEVVDPRPTATPMPDPSFTLQATKKSSTRWLVFGTPTAPLTIVAIAADGSVLATTTVSKLSFHRVGGTAACGGPMRSAAVVLEIPAG